MKSGRVYNKAMLEWLASHYVHMMLPELTAAFNKQFGQAKTVAQIKSCLANHKIRAGVKRNRTPRRYQDNHLAFLQTHYRTLNLEQLTEAFNKEFPRFGADVNSIRACLRNHRIQSGRTGQFEKGQESWNKGQKGINTGGEKGWFKSGAVPLNIKPLGSERVNVDGYVEIKVDEPNPYTGHSTRYRPKHQVVWESEHGPIPDGHVVIFKDNNKLNCDIDNLKLVSRAQLVVLNKTGLIGVPAEVKDTAVLIVDLKLKTRARQKREQNA